MENKNNDGFSYTYSAREQAEIRRIREKYADKEKTEESKMDRLRRLDAKVTQKAQSIALTLGILGALILGSGMSLIMTDLGAALGLSAEAGMLIGIPVGIAGGVLASLAFPIYNLVLRHERQRIAPEILRLTDDLIK